MSKKLRLHLYIIFTPFVVGAALEFLPPWLAWPIVFLGVVTWLGSCLMYGEVDKT